MTETIEDIFSKQGLALQNIQKIHSVPVHLQTD